MENNSMYNPYEIFGDYTNDERRLMDEAWRLLFEAIGSIIDEKIMEDPYLLEGLLENYLNKSNKYKGFDRKFLIRVKE